MPQGDVCLGLFLCTLSMCLGFSNLSSSRLPRLCFSCSLVTFSVSGLDFCMLAPYGTYGVHDKGMKSAGAEGAYLL